MKIFLLVFGLLGSRDEKPEFKPILREDGTEIPCPRYDEATNTYKMEPQK